MSYLSSNIKSLVPRCINQWGWQLSYSQAVTIVEVKIVHVQVIDPGLLIAWPNSISFFMSILHMGTINFGRATLYSCFLMLYFLYQFEVIWMAAG